MNEYINNFLLQNSVFLFLFLTWGIVWKGFGLWTAAKKNQKSWFIILLTVNTLGILEIVYIFFLKRVDLDQYFFKVKNLFTSRLKKLNIKK